MKHLKAIINECDHELVNDIIQWDSRNWSRYMADWEKEISQGVNIRCLEVGSGHGGLSLWFALKGLKITCSDLKDPAKLAKPLHEKYGVSDSVRYECINVLNIPYENYFDIIMFKSVLGNGNSLFQKRALQEMHKALKPKGKLLFAENLKGTKLNEVYAKVRFPSWVLVDLEDMKKNLCPFASVRLVTLGFLGALGISLRRNNCLGYLDAKFDRLVPEKWRYIIAGVAVKEG